MKFIIFALAIVTSSVWLSSTADAEPGLKMFSCNLSDSKVQAALRACPEELAKLKTEQVDQPVSVTCTQKYPEVVEYEFIFEACKTCRLKQAYLSVIENRRSTYGGAPKYDAYLRID